MNPTDSYFLNTKKWQKEQEILREICLDCCLNEELKWKQPCYVFKGNNILILGAFKEYCALNFFKGAFLADLEGILIQPTENVQAGRQLRFTNVEQILKLKAIIQAYIFEAIEVEKAGLKVEMTKSTNLIYPSEFQDILDVKPDFKIAFEKLTPGRQRAYNMFFSAPKQSETKTTRIEKSIHQIMNGFGLNDCTCGLSKKMPGCDGSHKI
jgi:uncharacterized protein YdeI (YjbR/CyaY-like superfamily)